MSVCNAYFCSLKSFVLSYHLLLFIHFEFQCLMFCMLSGHTIVGCFYLFSIRIVCVVLLSCSGAAFEMCLTIASVDIGWASCKHRFGSSIYFASLCGTKLGANTGGTNLCGRLLCLHGSTPMTAQRIHVQGIEFCTLSRNNTNPYRQDSYFSRSLFRGDDACIFFVSDCEFPHR